MFAWTEDKEANADHIGDSPLSFFDYGSQQGCHHNGVYHLDGYRLDTFGWQVNLLIRLELVPDSEVDLTVGVVPNITSSETSIALADVTYDIHNCAMLNGLATGCKPSITVLCMENFEVWYRVVPRGEPGIHGVVRTELQPLVPNIVNTLDLLCHNPSLHHILHKAEISKECILDDCQVLTEEDSCSLNNPRLP